VVTLDLEVHAYTFELSTIRDICAIGYQSLESTVSEPYLIEVGRTILYADVGASGTIGRLARLTTTSFPYTKGAFTLSGSNFSRGELPFIDLVLI